MKNVSEIMSRWCLTYDAVYKKINSNSAGRCVSLCAFLVKVANIHFLVGKYILLKKKDFYKFFLAILTSK